MVRALTAGTALAVLAVGCGSSAPSDVSLLRRACLHPPSASSLYDYSYETVDGRGVVTGVALCGSDGSVQGWDPRPSGSGDRVTVRDYGQPG